MATFDYARLAARADAILRRYGGAVSILRTANTGGVAWDPSQTIASHAAVAVVVDYDTKEIDGTTIQRGDRLAIISSVALAIEPRPGDQMVRGSEAWRVMDAERIDPAGSGAVIWIAQLRV